MAVAGAQLGMFSLQPGERPTIFVDTMEIGTEIAWSVGSGRAGRIRTAARLGYPVRISMQVAAEVPEKAHHLAERRGLDGGEARRLWVEECSTWIEVVQAEIEGSTDRRVLATAREDRTDVETALCAVQASPSVVLSKDHSLVDSGLAAPDSVAMLDALVKLAELEVGVEITGDVVAAVSRRLVDQWNGASAGARAALILAFALLAAWLLRDAERRSATAQAALESLRLAASGTHVVATAYLDAKTTVEANLVT